jgi:2-polyprenyl-6-methoxyphenol hydroxylase-like FAD-dependent oxidoreductase
MNPLPQTTDVVIVGAGPTGLTLACMLAAEGVPFILLDRLAEGLNTSRAAVIHARTLEVLEELNITTALRAGGLVVPQFTIRDRDRVLAAIRFDRLPTEYAALTAVISQHADERVLDEYERIRRPVAERVVAFTDGMTRMATLRHAPARAVRNLVLPIVSRIPAVQRRLTFELSGLRNRDQNRAAVRVQQPGHVN